MLQADSYRLPTDLSLRSLAAAEHSIIWSYVMASATHTALDAGCVRVARYTRRALRLRLRTLPPLAKMHAERPDGLIAIMHINWGSLVLACRLTRPLNPTPTPTPTPKQPVAKMRLQTTGKETMNCYVYINTARLPASA